MEKTESWGRSHGVMLIITEENPRSQRVRTEQKLLEL